VQGDGSRSWLRHQLALCSPPQHEWRANGCTTNSSPPPPPFPSAFPLCRPLSPALPPDQLFGATLEALAGGGPLGELAHKIGVHGALPT